MNIRVAQQRVVRRSVWQGKQGVAVFEVCVLGGFVQVSENTVQRSGRVFCLRLWTHTRVYTRFYVQKTGGEPAIAAAKWVNESDIP